MALGVEYRLLASGMLCLASAALGGCGGRTAELPEERRLGAELLPSAPGCQQRFSNRLQGHSCQHAQLGPFRQVEPVYEVGGDAPDVSRTHTTFQAIPVPATGGLARVRYRPRRDSAHAIFLEPDLPFELVSSASGELMEGRYRQPIDTCSELAVGAVFDLEQRGSYELWVNVPAPAAGEPPGKIRFNLFIEHLGTFEEPLVEGCP